MWLLGTVRAENIFLIWGAVCLIMIVNMLARSISKSPLKRFKIVVPWCGVSSAAFANLRALAVAVGVCVAVCVMVYVC